MSAVRPRALRELLFVVALFVAYKLGRLALTGDLPTANLANQYAAMPSLHVGWAAVVAVVLITTSRTRRRWLWLLHPLLTLAVVVATANHYWLDAAVALALLGAILLVPALASRSVVATPTPALAGGAQ